MSFQPASIKPRISVSSATLERVANRIPRRRGKSLSLRNWNRQRAKRLLCSIRVFAVFEVAVVRKNRQSQAIRAQKDSFWREVRRPLDVVDRRQPSIALIAAPRHHNEGWLYLRVGGRSMRAGDNHVTIADPVHTADTSPFEI